MNSGQHNVLIARNLRSTKCRGTGVPIRSFCREKENKRVSQRLEWFEIALLPVSKIFDRQGPEACLSQILTIFSDQDRAKTRLFAMLHRE